MTANRLFLLHHRNLQNRQHGFTFIELMMTITVLAILIGAALPAFGTFITSNRLSAQINELVGDLALARNEAAARSQRVQVCIASSATSCAATGSDWSAGRIVWADTNGNNSIDANEIIKYLPPLEGNVTLIASGPANTSTLSFLPQGLLATATNTWTFTLCAPGTSNGRQVTLPISGRATAKRISTC